MRSDAVVFLSSLVHFSGEVVALAVTVSSALVPLVPVTFSSLGLPSAGWVMDSAGRGIT